MSEEEIPVGDQIDKLLHEAVLLMHESGQSLKEVNEWFESARCSFRFLQKLGDMGAS